MGIVVISGMQLQDFVAPYVDIILHRGRFWAKSAALGSVRWCFRSCWTMLSHVPRCLLQSATAWGETNRILLAPALSSMHTMCPNRWHSIKQHREIGAWNLRHRETGAWNLPHREIGAWNLPHRQIGAWNLPHRQIGAWNLPLIRKKNIKLSAIISSQ